MKELSKGLEAKIEAVRKKEKAESQVKYYFYTWMESQFGNEPYLQNNVSQDVHPIEELAAMIKRHGRDNNTVLASGFHFTLLSWKQITREEYHLYNDLLTDIQD